jgi:hypothetical protein
MKIGTHLVTMLKARQNIAKSMKHTFMARLGTREAIHSTFSSRVSDKIF